MRFTPTRPTWNQAVGDEVSRTLQVRQTCPDNPKGTLERSSHGLRRIMRLAKDGTTEAVYASSAIFVMKFRTALY